MHRLALILPFLTLFTAACDSPDYVDDVEVTERQEVINTNAIVDHGRASVHTFESDDMVYSVKIGQSDDRLLMLSYSLKTDEGNYEHTVEYEFVETNEGVTLMAVNPETAEANAQELQARLAGTAIEAYLSSGEVDLMAGIAQEDLVTFRDCGWLFTKMVGLCGVDMAFLMVPHLVSIVAGVLLLDECLEAHSEWASCNYG